MTKHKEFAQELESLEAVFDALVPLDDEKRLFVLSTVVARLGVKLDVGAAALSGRRDQGTAPQADQQRIDTQMTPRLFLRNKHPTNDVQRIACLAYYLTHHRDTAHFKTGELTELNIQAAGDKIGNAAQAVANATKQNHFLSPAGKGRKQITPLGEDVVNALPDQQKVKVAIATETAGRRKRRARVGKKKKSK
jgi:hypothetical protein